MTIRTDIVGAEVGPIIQEIEARWLMAYAAGVGDENPVFLDTARRGGIVAHPLFPICYEWPLALVLREKTLDRHVAARAVHATHDLTIHRLPVPGGRLSTTARVVAVEQQKPGAYVVTRFETVDSDAKPVSTTDAGGLYLGVNTEGPDRWLIDRPGPPRPADSAVRWESPLTVAAGAAHVYTECSRIWNPIHTDRAAARGLGLPDIILHGSATLAMAVSLLVAREADGDPGRVRRLRCRFGAMVLMPATLTLQALGRAAGPEGEATRFRVLTERGEAAITEGVLILRGTETRLR